MKVRWLSIVASSIVGALGALALASTPALARTPVQPPAQVVDAGVDHPPSENW